MPAWDEWFRHTEEQKNSLIGEIGLVGIEPKDWKLFKWPSSSGLAPGSRKELGSFSPDVEKVLDYMESRFYRDYSVAGHVTYRGLLYRAVWRQDADSRNEDDLKTWERRIILDATVMRAALLSEMAVHFRLDSAVIKCREMWGYIRTITNDASDLWDIRYDQLLKPFGK